MKPSELKDKQRILKNLQKDLDDELKEYAKKTKQKLTEEIKITDKVFSEYIQEKNKIIEKLVKEIKDELAKQKKDAEEKKEGLKKIIKKLNDEILKELPPEEKKYEEMVIHIREIREEFSKISGKYNEYGQTVLEGLDQVIKSSRHEDDPNELKVKLEILKKQREFLEQKIKKTPQTENILKQFDEAQRIITDHLNQRSSFLNKAADFLEENSINIAGIAGAMGLKAPIVMLGAKFLDDSFKKRKLYQEKRQKAKAAELQRQREALRREEESIKIEEEEEKLYSQRRTRTEKRRKTDFINDNETSYKADHWTESFRQTETEPKREPERREKETGPSEEDYLLRIMNFSENQVDLLFDIKNILLDKFKFDKDVEADKEREEQQQEDKSAETKIEGGDLLAKVFDVGDEGKTKKEGIKEAFTKGIMGSVMDSIGEGLGISVGMKGAGWIVRAASGLVTTLISAGAIIPIVIAAAMVAVDAYMGKKLWDASKEHAKKVEDLREAKQRTEIENKEREIISKGNDSDILDLYGKPFKQSGAPDAGKILRNRDNMMLTRLMQDEEKARLEYRENVKQYEERRRLHPEEPEPTSPLAFKPSSEENYIKNETKKREEFEKWLKIKRNTNKSEMDVKEIRIGENVYTNPILEEGFYYDPSTRLSTLKSGTKEQETKDLTQEVRQPIPQNEAQTTSSLPMNWEAYKKNVYGTESSGNYEIVNSANYLGKYQMGATALADAGYVKPGTTQQGLNDPNNWIRGSKEEFLKDKNMQEEAFQKFTQKNYDTLLASGAITKESSPGEVAGALKAAHLSGAKGAERYLKEGYNPSDSNGTSAADYYAQGKASQEQQLAMANETNSIVPTASQTVQDYNVANASNQGAKLEAAVAPKTTVVNSGGGKGTGGSVQPATGGSGGVGRAAPRGNEYTLQSALNTDFSGSSA